MKNLMKHLSPFLFLVTFSASAEIPYVNPDWIQNPEDNMQAKSLIPWGTNAKLEKMVTGIFSSMRESIEEGPKKESHLNNNPNIPNWTPWHLEAFTTELSVLDSGAIGLLSERGNLTAIAFWRRQGPKTNKVTTFTGNEDTSGLEEGPIPSVNLDEVYDENSLTVELAPMINAALSTGKIKNEEAFRANVALAAIDFYKLTSSVSENPGMKWWVSALRLDLAVAASGKLITLPLASVGGEVRIRFDWRRLMKNKPAQFITKNFNHSSFLSNDLDKTQSSFVSLVSNLSKDLELSIPVKLEEKGLKPYTMRIGIGLTVAGNVGIARASAQAIAQVYFSRNQAAPRVYPRLTFIKALSDSAINSNVESYSVIEGFNEKHIEYAKNNQIPFTIENNLVKPNVIYQVNRNEFKKGLKKAFDITDFFAKAGQKAESKKWKLFQMKTSLDLSLSGTVGVTTLTGLTTAELSLYNMNF